MAGISAVTDTPQLVVETFDYDGMVNWFKDYYNITDKNISDWVRGSAEYGVDELSAVEDLIGERVDFFKTSDGKYNVTAYDTATQLTDTNPLDSNLTTIKRGNFKQMLNRAKDSVTDKLNITRFPASGSFGDKATYLVGSVGSAFGAVSAGIALGKTIDSVLYNANPDFWDSVGMSSLNPETWNSITIGDDSAAAGLFNMILGLNPDTGQSQLYMDQNAFAYMAYYMKDRGVFSDAGTHIDINVEDVPPDFNITIVNPSPHIIEPAFIGRYGYNTPQESEYTLHYAEFINNTSPVYTFAYSDRSPTEINAVIKWAFFSENPFTVISHGMNSTATTTSTFNSINTKTYDNKSCHTVTSITTYNTNFKAGGATLPGTVIDLSGSNNIASLVQPNTQDGLNSYLWSLLYESDIYESGGIDGITNQPDATLPDVSTWNDIPSTLQSLQTQYPDMWNDALTWDNVQPDGTNPQLVYVPVPMPNATSGVNPYPTSGEQTQTDTLINPSTFPKELTKILTEILQNPQPKTDTSTQPIIPPQNPVDTGTGGTITPIAPTGNASALWSVYHPTQSQVNQFGGWLWSADIITQIQQVLQNPMEGIITLHKVFVPPIDSGTGTIVVGRLDSRVPSATVTAQYVEVDCGTIDCYEYFGNVFDYAPYTNASLYLPFIGIVPLDVSDIMRATINVIYRVDVFTGACLAMVIIARDGNTINLYQYSGVASVEYPLTGQMHSGLISGLLGIAGGVAGLAMSATGAGAIAGIGAIAGGLVNANKTNQARASGFSGSSGAMGIKIPYLILQRPQTKVAGLFAELRGFKTNVSGKLGTFSGNVVVNDVHVSGINATDNELVEIESILKSGVIV